MKNRLRKMSHKEFISHINFLSKQLKEFLESKCLKIDYICPILRSGAVPAVYIANKLNIVKFASFQAKHITYKNKEEKIELLFNPLRNIKIEKEQPVFLLVEGTHSTGKSVELCITEIYKIYPKAKILYVSIAKFYGSKDFKEKIFYENHALYFNTSKSIQECKKLKINPYLAIYPWEILESEVNHPDDLEENIFF